MEQKGWNLTLVAFYGPKPEPLAQLVDATQSILHSELGPAYFPYATEQVHATIIGLEGWRVGMDIMNDNAARANGVSGPVDLNGLLHFLQEMPPLQILIGGFLPTGRYPFTSRDLPPYTRSFAINGSLAVMMGWPVAGESYPMTLDVLRRECMRFNVLHKYHLNESAIDNDFFLVLGIVKSEAIPVERVEFVRETLQQFLAHRKPLDMVVQPENLSVIVYDDPKLPIGESIQYSLVEALKNEEELRLFYRDVS
jgi:hypothetical protein